MKKIIHAFGLCLLSQFLIAQSKIQGTVIDENNDAVIGATIKVANKGVVTDVNGFYSISIEEGVLVLECSYVGYEPVVQTINIKNKEEKTVDIKLEKSKNLLNQLTVTSGRYEKPLGEVTVSMEVLKPDIIERNNTQTIDNVLQKVPGVSIIGGQANIRGGSGFSYGAGTRVLILVDDIPALQADAGLPNWNDFQVETIESIEVLKGAASALYGSSALNGVINLRTAYAKDKPITTFQTFYAGYGNPKDTAAWYPEKRPYDAGFSLTHRQKIKKLDLVLGTNWRVSRGYNEHNYDSLGRFTIGTRYRINDRLYVGFNSNINFGVSKYFFYWENGTNGVFKATPSTITRSQKTRYTIDPFVSYHDKRGNRHKLLGRFYSIANNVSGGNQNASDLYYGEYQFQRSFKHDLVLTAGVVASGTYVKAEVYGDTTYRSLNLASYIQADKKFGKLSLSLGGRIEQFVQRSPELVQISKFIQKFDTIPNGITKEAKPVFRLGANYQLTKFTYLRASAGQGYRFPTIAERFITSNLSSAFVIPNVKLKSETGWSTELGIKQGIKLGNWYGFLDVAGFWTEYQDMMEFVFIPNFLAFQSQNIGNTRIRGLETTLAGTGKIGNVNVSMLAGYTYIDPRFKDFGDREKKDLSVDYNILKYRFRHTGKADIEATYKGFSIGYALYYNNHMEAIDKIFETIIPGVKEFRDANNNGATVMDVRASYSFLKYYKLSFMVKNATNVAYTLRPALMEAPRNVNIRLDVKF